MVGAVGDPHLQRVDRHGIRALAHGQAERAEFCHLERRPAKIAHPPQRALQSMRDRFGDQRRNAHRRAIGKIIIVDHAEINTARAAIHDHVDRPVQIQRNAERAGKAVGGAERQQRKHAVMPNEIVHRRRQRPVAAPNDNHRRALLHRPAYGIAQLLRVTDGEGLVDSHALRAQSAARAAEELASFTRPRVDDERGVAGQVFHHPHNAGSAVSGAICFRQG